MTNFNFIWIVPIEPIDKRYTKQWFDEIPESLMDVKSNYVVHQIEVEDISSEVPQGKFLDFAGTNVYKGRQIECISQMFSDGVVAPRDKFLVTDAWSVVIPAIRYISELNEVPVEIHSIWHAGNYDPTDILGMKMNSSWASNFERACYYASDCNYFATNFHREMFLRNLAIPQEDHNRAFRSGQPHGYLMRAIQSLPNKEKEDLILWPHRYNSDKQPDIAERLAKELPEFKITSNDNLSKVDYYSMLKRAKAVFSCSLHENFGIAMAEGVLAGCIPIVPNRACYSEIYLPEFKYPSAWTENIHMFNIHRSELIAFIEDRVNNYDKFARALEDQKKRLENEYLTPTIMMEKLFA